MGGRGSEPNVSQSFGSRHGTAPIPLPILSLLTLNLVGHMDVVCESRSIRKLGPLVLSLLPRRQLLSLGFELL